MDGAPPPAPPPRPRPPAGWSLPQLTDAELIDLARGAGDVDAFGELVRRHRDAAYRVALRICRTPADAEDVAQDAFVRAWRALADFRGDARFTTWLYRIVTNLALNRVTRRREDATDDLPERTGVVWASPVSTAGSDPARRVEDAERLAAALTALDALTPEQRACFVLRELEGLSYEELGEVLDISVQSVRGRLYRARADLAAALDRYDQGASAEPGPGRTGVSGAPPVPGRVESRRVASEGSPTAPRET